MRGNPSTGYLPSLRKNTSPQKKRPSGMSKRRETLLRSEYIILGAVALTFLRVWRSGLKTHLNLWEFIMNHTIWGDPVEYVPEENYEELAP